MTLSSLSDRGTLRGTLQRNSGNYNDLINKPAINGHTLIGNQSGHALGLANEDDIINVEANPLGEAAADLHKILIDDRIYAIPDVVVYGEASGAIASFDDGGNNKPLKSLKVAINPVQASGTPSPSNPLPISGWTGANVQRCGKNIFYSNDGTYVNSSNTQIVINNGIFRLENITPYPLGVTSLISADGINNIMGNNKYLKAGTYNFSCNIVSLENVASVTAPYLKISNLRTGVQTNVSNNSTFTITEPYSIDLVTASVVEFKKDAKITYTLQIEVGTSASDYEPYNGTTYPITWSDAGEVFGGYIEFKDGEWKAYKTHIIETVNPNNINMSVNIFTYTISSMRSGNAMEGLCDYFKTVSSSSEYGVRFGASNNIAYFYKLMDNIPEITNLASAKQWFTDNTVHLYVPLETPIEFDLDSPLPNIQTLLGNNNIWSDTGEVIECIYERDLNIAINKALSQ